MWPVLLWKARAGKRKKDLQSSQRMQSAFKLANSYQAPQSIHKAFVMISFGLDKHHLLAQSLRTRYPQNSKTWRKSMHKKQMMSMLSKRRKLVLTICLMRAVVEWFLWQIPSLRLSVFFLWTLAIALDSDDEKAVKPMSNLRLIDLRLEPWLSSSVESGKSSVDCRVWYFFEMVLGMSCLCEERKWKSREQKLSRIPPHQSRKNLLAFATRLDILWIACTEESHCKLDCRA